MPTQILRESHQWETLALRAKRAQGSVDRCAVARPVERARPPRPAYGDRCESGLSSGKHRSDRAERTARVRSCQGLGCWAIWTPCCDRLRRPMSDPGRLAAAAELDDQTSVGARTLS